MNGATEQTTTVPETVPAEIVREHTIEEILADSKIGAARYVKDYDAGRGGE